MNVDQDNGVNGERGRLWVVATPIGNLDDLSPRARDTLRIAGALSAPSLNDVTDELRVEAISGTAIVNGTQVVLEALGPDVQLTDGLRSSTA